MKSMNEAAWRAFVMQGSRTGKLATVRKDGRPHVVPVWFTLDGPDIVFMTDSRTIKYKNMQRDPRASLCVDDEQFPFAYVAIQGTAKIEALAPAELLPYSMRIAGRYVGQDRAQAFGERNAVEGEVLIRLSPTKVTAMQGIAD